MCLKQIAEQTVLMAVSYTHLDVYKRQGLTSLGTTDLEACAITGIRYSIGDRSY